MSGSSPIIRHATREDIEAYSTIPNKPTLLAWVADLDGQLLGIGGFHFTQGRWFGFCDLKSDMRRYKLSIARAGRMIMAEAKRQGIRFVYADADLNEANSVRWLCSLGFRLDPRSEYLYRWDG